MPMVAGAREAATLIPRLSGCRLEYVEQPVPPEIEAWRELAFPPACRRASHLCWPMNPYRRRKTSALIAILSMA